MSDVIRAYGMSMAQNGICRKCKLPLEKGNHSKCDRWPATCGVCKGFHFKANTEDTTIKFFKNIVDEIVAGESPDQAIRFEIKILAVAKPKVPKKTQGV